MPYAVYHDRKPAHSSERLTDPQRKTDLTYCSRCEDWFLQLATPKKEWKTKRLSDLDQPTPSGSDQSKTWTLLDSALLALQELKTVAVYEQDGWDGVGDSDTQEKRTARIEDAIRTADRVLGEAEKASGRTAFGNGFIEREP